MAVALTDVLRYDTRDDSQGESLAKIYLVEIFTDRSRARVSSYSFRPRIREDRRAGRQGVRLFAYETEEEELVFRKPAVSDILALLLNSRTTNLWLLRGKKKPPRLTREARSNIRFMSKYGVADSTMAERLHITQRRIGKAINNGYNPPDNLDSDDDHVSREVAERFPRKASRTYLSYHGI
jgi:hypothetical protein